MPSLFRSTRSLSSPKSRGAEPERAVVLVGEAPLAPAASRRALDLAARRRCACSDVMTSKRTPKSAEVASCSSRWMRERRARRSAAQRLRSGQVGEARGLPARASARRSRAGTRRGSRPRGSRRRARRLLDPRPEALGQLVDLHAGVVDVELAGDGVAGPLESAAMRVAQRRAAAVADVQRAGGVGGDELDVDLEAGAPRRCGRSRDPAARIAATCGGELVLGEPEVDEPGPGDLDPGDDARRAAAARPRPARPRARGLLRCGRARTHGEVGGEVAVAGVARALEDEVDPSAPEPGGDPLELGAEQVAHSWRPSWPAWPSRLGAADSGFALLSDLPARARLLARLRRLLALRLAGALPVLAVVGDVEPAAPEHEPGPAGDLPRPGFRKRDTWPGACRSSSGTSRTRGLRGTVLVGRHGHSVRVNEVSRLT